MKKKRVLVLQLARLGDIYQTWPVLRALKRTEPDTEIHFLTRSRFAVAAPTDGVVDRQWKLDTRDILTPLIDELPNHDASLARLETFSRELASMNFDKIVNLSFSPFSSYLVKAVAGEGCEIHGYTRTADGYLAIPDDGSAYFYAQVGPNKGNRVHVTDLFAHVAGVELDAADWVAPETNVASQAIARELRTPIVVHVGASTLAKTLSSSKWLQVLKGLCSEHEGQVVVVGSAEEAEIAERACAFTSENPLVNLVGKTTLAELFEIVRNAKCVVGGDSAPIQIASLTGTPCLNVSFPQVSFWETGPRAAGSRIITIDDEASIESNQIVDEVLRIVRGKSPGLPGITRVVGPTVPYLETIPQPNLFVWELLRSIYMGDAFPAPPNETFVIGVQRLAEVNRLAIEQLECIRRVQGNKTSAAIIDRCDEIMEQVQRFVPELAPLVRWFRTERIRIGPMSVDALVTATEAVHIRLADVLALYEQNDPAAPEENGNDDVVLE